MRDDTPLETELKLEASPGALDALAAAPALADVAFVERPQRSTYFDTADRALRGAGLSLRVRRVGDKRIQTVKVAGVASAGLFARAEWEREIEGDVPVLGDTSGPLASLLPGLVAADIQPVFTVAVSRRTGMVVRDGGEMEVVVDSGEIVAGDDREAIAEVEIELKGGSPAALFSLAHALDAVAPLRLGVLAKSDRGYALGEGRRRDKAVKAEQGVLAGEMTAAEAFARIANSCLGHFRRNEAVLTRTGGADALHQARVAIRRLRSALATFRPILADERYDFFRGELRWLAAMLGEGRDIDVLLARSEGELADRLRTARERVYAEVEAALASPRTRTLMINLAEWIALGDWRSSAEGQRPADRFAAQALDKLRRRIKRKGAGLAELDDEDRHEVRKLAKQLRYAAEFFAGLFPGKKGRRRAEAFLAALEDLQEQLGELNDLAHGPHVLARLGINAAPELAPPGRRERLIERAAAAHDRLVDVKRFWR